MRPVLVLLADVSRFRAPTSPLAASAAAVSREAAEDAAGEHGEEDVAANSVSISSAATSTERCLDALSRLLRMARPFSSTKASCARPHCS